eukprot:TRINITY_DN1405_c0_g1_i1.p2 TRINITY_DN1405_c0_g1~~TRINITY_DN1405_c0_g1_i1.p2  ORF type:complete len:164 (-),score=40.29 TRINITY_DN1405_c0_g1_i1:33-524(-)
MQLHAFDMCRGSARRHRRRCRCRRRSVRAPPPRRNVSSAARLHTAQCAAQAVWRVRARAAQIEIDTRALEPSETRQQQIDKPSPKVKETRAPKKKLAKNEKSAQQSRAFGARAYCVTAPPRAGGSMFIARRRARMAATRSPPPFDGSRHVSARAHVPPSAGAA